MSCVHIFYNVESEFEAMNKFESIEKEFTADLLSSCQKIVHESSNEIKQGSDVQKAVIRNFSKLVDVDVTDKAIEEEKEE